MNVLHRLAGFYFFAFGSIGALYPLLPLLLAGRGLAADEISWVMAVPPVLNLFVPALWGVAADAYQARTQALRAVSFGTACATLAFLWGHDLAAALAAMVAMSFFRAPVAALADSATYAALGVDRAGFARIRAWGSVGFVVFVSLAGWLDAADRPVLLVGLGAAVMFAAGGVSLGLAAPPVVRERSVLERALAHVVRARLTLLFLANALYYGAHATFDNLFALHVKALGLPASLVGTAWAVAVAAEVAMMFQARRVVAARRSWDLLVFSGAVSAVRWLLLSVVTQPVLLVSLQLLHAVTFGLWYITLVTHVQDRVPAELRSSVHGVFYTSLGLGTLGGILAGGWFLQHLDGAWMFRASAAAALLAMGLYAWLGRRDARAPRAATALATDQVAPL